jgi:hypothetical protein
MEIYRSRSPTSSALQSLINECKSQPLGGQLRFIVIFLKHMLTPLIGPQKSTIHNEFTAHYPGPKLLQLNQRRTALPAMRVCWMPFATHPWAPSDDFYHVISLFELDG